MRHAQRSNLGVLMDDADHVPAASERLQDGIHADRTPQPMHLDRRVIDEDGAANVSHDCRGLRHLPERRVGR